MEKQRTHLTPEEVQEFIAMGIDFGETADVYRRTKWGAGEVDNWVRCRNVDFGLKELIAYQEIPAPNLQEVISKLPECIGDYDLSIKPYGRQNMCAIVVYETMNCCDRMEHKAIEDSKTILDSARDMLCWVCENYPEKLTK